MIERLGQWLRQRAQGRTVERLGRTGLVGLSLWLLSAWLAVGGVAAWQAHGAGQLRRPIDALPAATSPGPSAERATGTPRSGLPTSLSVLPSEQDARGSLRQAVATATEQGLVSGEISQTARGTFAAQEIELQLQLAGSYPTLRRYLTETLNACPTALLRELSLRRDPSDPARVQARVRMVFLAKAMP